MSRFPGGPRRPRPWPRRPVEWFDGNSSPGADSDPEDPCGMAYKHYACGKAIFELVGQTDTAHLDKDVVTVERVVGRIDTNVTLNDLTNDNWYGVIRYGILVVGENEDLSTYQIPDLREAVDIEKYEWMTLAQRRVEIIQLWGNPPTGGAPAILEDTVGRCVYEFDIKVKRKLSKNDKLCMVRFFPGITAAAGTLVYHETRLIRVLTKN